ncbi:MAG: UDP-N-acetyl glucosamine 2-epimerase, partial [Planctomycetota bacterium]
MFTHAPLVHALLAHNSGEGEPIDWQLVHTGQHYDRNMSDSFFEDLGIPAPHFNLEVGGGSHAENTGKTMIQFEKLLQESPTGLVLVVGDVNATMACAIVAAKLVVPVAHVEAGLRSFDMSMPEEVNRIVTDRLSNLLFTTDPSALEHLASEGVDPGKIHPVGNVMIDTLLKQKERASEITQWNEWKAEGPYGLMTLHRPANVDSPEVFGRLAEVLAEVSQELRLIFPRHPRT